MYRVKRGFRPSFSGAFGNGSDVRSEFETTELQDSEILYAEYDVEFYNGSAVVLFLRDGKLYEVHGSHCSCYGLEGQWEPEETTLEVLLRRPMGGRMSIPAAVLGQIVQE